MGRISRICIHTVLCMLLCALVQCKTQEEPPPEKHVVKMLLVGDPFAETISSLRKELEEQSGFTIELEVLDYDETRKFILDNIRLQSSEFDIVSFDVVWVGELAERKILQPLDHLLNQPTVQKDDLFPITLEVGSWNQTTYGLPIQPHAEILWYRKDLLEEAGVKPPTTTEEVLSVLEQVAKPEDGLYGICWNAHRGQALGQTMAHFYAAFGQALLDTDGMPTLDGPGAVRAAEYALQLKEHSPPDVLQMAWDHRIARFREGKAVMTYGWGGRSYLAESDPLSKVSGKVGYLPAPAAEGVAPVTPLGSWHLGIPANMDESRIQRAEEFLAWITGESTIKLLSEKGNTGSSRFSQVRDEKLIRAHPLFPVMDQMAAKGVLSAEMRPSIPEWNALCEIMGTVYHDMLGGELTPADAAREAQRQALELFATKSR